MRGELEAIKDKLYKQTKLIKVDDPNDLKLNLLRITDDVREACEFSEIGTEYPFGMTEDGKVKGILHGEGWGLVREQELEIILERLYKSQVTT